jgi:hypothetical protein
MRHNSKFYVGVAKLDNGGSCLHQIKKWKRIRQDYVLNVAIFFFMLELFIQIQNHNNGTTAASDN